MTGKHWIGATVTACSQEKNPNEIPATLPNARCGNLAVPPATGYIPPSSAWTRARTKTAAPAITQQIRAAAPTAWAAKNAPNSQPEPMIEVSDAQVAPINPISRFSPTSAGAVCGATDCVAMSNLLSVRARVRDTGLPTSWDHRIDLQSAWKVLKQHLFRNAGRSGWILSRILSLSRYIRLPWRHHGDITASRRELSRHASSAVPGSSRRMT